MRGWYTKQQLCCPDEARTSDCDVWSSRCEFCDENIHGGDYGPKTYRLPNLVVIARRLDLIAEVNFTVFKLEIRDSPQWRHCAPLIVRFHQDRAAAAERCRLACARGHGLVRVEEGGAAAGVWPDE
jgi:hypothetical protein